MRSRQERTADIQNAIGELAALFEYGELHAQTDPAGFIRVVVEYIKGVREERAREES